MVPAMMFDAGSFENGAEDFVERLDFRFLRDNP